MRGIKLRQHLPLVHFQAQTCSVIMSKPQESHSHILMTGEGGGILAKSGFFRSMKDTGVFWVAKKNRGIILGCKKGLRGFLDMLKKVVIFLSRQILKL